MKLGIRQHMILDLASITLPVTHKLIAKIDPSPISKIHESTHFINLILNLKHELHRELKIFKERERPGVALWWEQRRRAVSLAEHGDDGG